MDQQLYAQADLTPEDIQMAIIHDNFTPFVLPHRKYNIRNNPRLTSMKRLNHDENIIYTILLRH